MYRLVIVLLMLSSGAWASSQTKSVLFDWPVVHGEVLTKAMRMVEASQLETTINQFVNRSLKLNASIVVRFYEGDEQFFDARENQIYIPASLLSQLYNRVIQRYEGEFVQQSIFTASLEQLLWYELGRALVFQYALPITGNEAYALDAFASVMMLNLRDNPFILDAAEEFLLVERSNQWTQDGAQQSEAEFDRARYQLIVCMTLGKDRRNYERYLEALSWTPEHLQQCEQRYRDQVKAWYGALTPHLHVDNPMRFWLPAGSE